MVERLDRKNEAACQEYEQFVHLHPNGSFMQSLRWAEVKSNWMHEALVVRDRSGAITGSVLLLIQPVPYSRKHILYAPRGPVCGYDDSNTLQQLMNGIQTVARAYHACLFRADPNIDAGNKHVTEAFRKLGFRHRKNAPEFTTVQPRNSYVLSLHGKTEDNVFMGFHQKWRYNVRLAKRKGVICGAYGVKGLDAFYALLQETGARDGFAIRSKDYFHKLLTAFGENARLYICSYNGIPLSGAVVVRDRHTVSYLYGASTAKYRNFMPNYLMQWSMIRWAMESGCRAYDFMGIPHYDKPEHPNYGVYRFKKGFGGSVHTAAGEFDLYLSPVFGRMAAACIRTKIYLSRFLTEKRASAAEPQDRPAAEKKDRAFRLKDFPAGCSGYEGKQQSGPTPQTPELLWQGKSETGPIWTARR